MKAGPKPSFSTDLGVLGVVEYYGYRYYHTNLGRWLSRDPIGSQGGFNLYAAMNNNVTNATDFLGLDPIFTTLVTKEDLWNAATRDPKWLWPFSWAKTQVGNHENLTERMENSCPCTKEGVMAGYNKLINKWAEWAGAYQFILGDFDGVRIGCEGKTGSSSCITVNTDFFTFLGSKTPNCWTCSMQEGWRNKTPDENAANTAHDAIAWLVSGKLTRANHWWVTCVGKDSQGNVVKVAAFDYWRRTSDVWGGMSPTVNTKKYPFKSGIYEEPAEKIFYPIW